MDFLQFAPLLKSVCLIDLYTYEMNFTFLHVPDTDTISD